MKSDTAKKGKFFFLNLSILRVNIVGHGFRHFRVNGPVKGEGAGAVDPMDQSLCIVGGGGKLLAGKTLDPNGLRDELLHSIACKSAIKAGWQTSDEELRRLVQEVLTRDDIKYCPHGRPVCVTLTKRQLEKQFKRV